MTFLPVITLALVLDIIGVILICFGLDDLGILDTIGIAVFGLWIFWRSGGKRDLSDRKPVSTKVKSAQIKKQGSALLKRLGKVGLRVGITAIFEFIPYVGAILFGWTILVIIEFASDIKNFSLEAGE